MSMMREFVRMVGEGKTGKTDASVSVAESSGWRLQLKKQELVD